MMEPVIKVEGLKKYFGDVRAVDDISFEVERGELFGFLGINGAGKSTTINMLCTLYAATAGSVEVCGYQVGKQDEEVRKRIGVVYQGNCLDDKLTVAENLFVRGVLYEKDHRKLRADIRRICGILELEDVYHRRLAKLSGGQKTRVSLGKLLVTKPDVLLLDEPTNHLDMESITALNNGLIKFPGVVLFASRDHQVVQTTANRIIEFLPDGTFIDKVSTYDEYLENDEMARKRQVYSMSADEENDN